MAARQSSLVTTCPHIIWAIHPFSKAIKQISKTFTFLKCEWAWEYFVEMDGDRGFLVENATLYLRRLSPVSDCPVTRFSTFVSINDPSGKKCLESSHNVDVSSISKRLVWKQPKLQILQYVKHNSCTFSLTIEPFGDSECVSFFGSCEEFCTPNCLRQLSEDFSCLLKDSGDADVIIRCRNKDIKAHKRILCFRSRKFDEILQFTDNLEELDVNGVCYKLVNIEMDPEVLDMVINYIYTAALPVLTEEIAKKIYPVAIEYRLESLKERCANCLIENFSFSKAIDLLILADKYADDHLKWAIASFIANDVQYMHCFSFRKFSENNKELAIYVFQMFTELELHRLQLKYSK